jgi:peptide/nickel transport system ATP-binding protein
MSLLFVTHNLGVVAQYADAVAVMYAGRIVESAPVHELFATPAHPYTRGLLACLPGVARQQGTQGSPHPVIPAKAGTQGFQKERPQAARRRLVAIPGQVSSPLAPPPGCAFGPRCSLHHAACDTAMPTLAQIAPRRQVRCIAVEMMK